MTKRVEKKYLTEDERKILKLYHAATSVSFYRFNESMSDAKAFVGIWGSPQIINSPNDRVLISAGTFENGKSVSAIASIEAGGTK
ncbi:hypothetical protein [Loigolactobacillus jiayinensis]|uniref:Transposase n=1 Tax=Loigolactobacillus jiayinensis TaxID=2486016 RepID=A0ABW1RCJ3_9LACO|nr:hypothetical protein [Loigolactobacillus jiayinensis]